jgi:nitric oxide reductase subunit C
VKVSNRKLMMSSLVACFAIQTGLVYSDETAYQNAPLTSLALEGRELWMEHNCQTCHQIYGFGGFLGPDLTNAAGRLTRDRLEQVLTVGSLQMPAFGFSSREIAAMESYLVALNDTGIGQARKYIPVPAQEIFAAMDAQAEAQPMSEAAAAAYGMFKTICASCHTPFRSTPLGQFLAVDLSDVHSRLSESEIRKVLSEGRPAKGMVITPLTQTEQDGMLEFLEWLNAQREPLMQQVGEPTPLESLPWWEYR